MNKCPQCGGSLNNDEITSRVCPCCGCKLDSEELAQNASSSASEKTVYFSSGTIIWISFCIIVNLWGANTNISNGDILLGIIGLLHGGLYIWLLIGKMKLTFYLIVVEVILAALTVFTLYNLFFISLFSLVNPIITYLFISKQWDKMK